MVEEGVILVKSALRGVSRGLLAVTLMTAVFALCPCVVRADPAMSDCCPQRDVSISGMCCERAVGSASVASSASALVSISASVTVQPAANQPVLASVPAQPTFVRPVVARTILRI